MRIVSGLATVLLTVAMAATAAAQGPAKPAVAMAANPVVRPSDIERCDKQVAYCLLLDNWKEVEVARALAPQLQSAEVKQFASQLVDDHSDALETLRAIACESTATKPAAAAAPTATRPAKTPPDKPAAKTAQATPHNLPFLQMKQHLTDQYVQTITEELTGKSAMEVDHSFLEYQVFCHTALVDELIVMKNYASPALQVVLDQAIQVSRQHLDRAKKLLQSIENRETTTAATGGNG